MTTHGQPVHYLVSPAGIPNYGDELIAMAWLRHLAAVAPETEVVVDCLGPEEAARRMSALHPKVRFTNVLWQLCTRHWSREAVRTADAVTASLAAPDPELEPGLRDLRAASVLHLVGGGFVNALWPPFAGLLAALAAVARETGATTAMTGQGLWPPAPGADRLVRSLAERFDVVDLRDAASARLVGDPDGLSADDVFLDAGPHLFRSGEPVPDLMVSVQSMLAQTAPEELLRFVADTARAWGATGIGLLECAPDQDEDVLALAQRVLPQARRYSLDDVLTHGLPVRAGQRWISTRFHPHLVAAVGGASGTAVDIRPDYYGTKHRSLLECGSRWRLLERLEVPAAAPDAGGYAPAEVEKLRQAKRAVADRIYRAG